MPRISSTWLVGSVEGLAAQQVDYGLGDVEVLPAGNWYLRHANPALGMLERMQAVIGLDILGFESRVRPDRLVELSAPGVFSLSWASAPSLPGLLGFTSAPLAGQPRYIADGISPLLFSAGHLATTPVGDGQAGYPEEDEHIQVSADGSIVDSEFHNVHVYNEFTWRHVMAHRVRASDLAPDIDKGGTWHRFRELVLLPNYRWQAYEQVFEDAAGGDDDLVWPVPLGTYKRRKLPRGRYGRDVRNANTRWSVSVEAIQQLEYPDNA